MLQTWAGQVYKKKKTDLLIVKNTYQTIKDFILIKKYLPLKIIRATCNCRKILESAGQASNYKQKSALTS